MHVKLPVAQLLCLCALSTAATAQGIQTLVMSGQSLGGLGVVDFVRGVQVNDSGEAIFGVRFVAGTGSTTEAVISSTGAVLAQEGQSVADPAGATLLYVAGEIAIDASGAPYFYATILGPVTTNVDDDVCYKGTSFQKLLQRGSVANAPQLPAGATYPILFRPKYNSAGNACLHVFYRDPAQPGLPDRKAFVKIDLATGQQTVICKEGDTLPGQTFDLQDLIVGHNQFAINDSGQVLYRALTSGPQGTQSVMYRDSTLLVQQNAPTPWGDTYDTIGYCDMNNVGEVVFHVGQTSQRKIVKYGGEQLVSVGDVLPAIHPYKLNYIAQRLKIGDEGKVLWVGQWSTPGANRIGLFLDYALIVEEGATQINGLTVTNMDESHLEANLSPSGQFLIFDAELEGGVDGAFLIDLWQ